MQVDEDLAPEEVVHLGLSRGVLGHEPLERARLRAGEVIDVHVGIPLELRVDQVHQALERPPLAVAIVGPERLVPRLGAVEQEHAEEVLEPACGLEERVTLEIEDDVTG